MREFFEDVAKAAIIAGSIGAMLLAGSAFVAAEDTKPKQDVFLQRECPAVTLDTPLASIPRGCSMTIQKGSR